MFKKILIANRAEIACRIIRTAKRMKIATVAIYSDADRDAVHVRAADEAVHVGAAPAAESYLDIDAIIDACKRTGAEAVHPGYGFLSENAQFARALAEAGIVFIGPGVEAIEAMGDKIASKALAKRAGVSTIPGHDEVVADASQAVAIADGLGYPVMIKASAGGGGKGMRVAHTRAEVESGFARASSEAASSFGDDRILIEKFIEQPRHIEIQIIADAHGNAVALNERECSIQRRHQKVIEEAPSPFIDADTRVAMHAQAIALAKAVAYRSAGTVEMVVDAERNFFFLEMNTRLQVEHPVTELITGIDLVELMIRVAAGEKLKLRQRDVGIDGWAMEARIYAENPYRGFLPSSGRLVRYRPPPAESFTIDDAGNKPRVRLDVGVEEGSEISRYYDPMIAKLVTWGEDRASAIAQMRDALDRYCIRGVDTNLPFVSAIVAHPKFHRGELDTDFIAREYADGFAPMSRARMEESGDDFGVFVAVAVLLHDRLSRRAAATSGQLADGYGRAVGASWVVEIDGEYHPAQVHRAPQSSSDEANQCSECRVECNGVEYVIEHAWRATELVFSARINGAMMHLQVERRGHEYDLARGGNRIHARVLSPRTAMLHAQMPRKAPPDLSRFLLSPMPGLLVSLSVGDGDAVKAGQSLAVIEAMKMENELRAEHDGVVARVMAQAGDTLEADQMILEFASDSSASN